MNGVTGRMGYRQHLVRSILPLRDEGGLQLEDGSVLGVEPILVGRDETRLREMAEEHGIAEWTTDLDKVMADESIEIYFDAQVTSRRPDAVRAAIAAGKHVYAEKPSAEHLADALDLARLAAAAGTTTGVVHDKLYLPGLIKLRRLVDDGFFGRITSLRGEFGYWVFEGDDQPAQRPSWNYRAEDGGGITVDMFAHWNYVLEAILGPVRAVYARSVTHIDERWDEHDQRYDATADDAAYAIFETDGVVAQINSSWVVRGNADGAARFRCDGRAGSAVPGRNGCVAQSRAATPRPVWNPDVPTDLDFRAGWEPVEPDAAFANGFRVQWEEFLRDVAAGRPHRHDLYSAARGVQLAELGLRSSAEGRRIVVPELRS